MKRQRSPSDESGVVSDDDHVRITIEEVKQKWKVDWKDISKSLKKMIDEGEATALKGMMRYFEVMSGEDNDDEWKPFVDMRESMDRLGMNMKSLKVVKKLMRKICRSLNFEETVSPGDGSTLFRAPESLCSEVCDPFILMELLFEETTGITFEEYFKKNKVKKRKKDAPETNTLSSLPDHLKITGIDKEGKPVLGQKTLLEMHNEGLTLQEDIDKAIEFTEKQQQMNRRWGDEARLMAAQDEAQKLDYDDGMEDWNKSRFDRSIIEKGTGTVQSKESANDFVNKLSTVDRFGKGVVTKSFI